MSQSPDQRIAGLHELTEFASARGGECLSSEFAGPGARHLWRCAVGHKFEATPRLLLEGGHWCEACQPNTDAPGAWDWDGIAEKDPILARFHQSPRDCGPGKREL